MTWKSPVDANARPRGGVRRSSVTRARSIVSFVHLLENSGSPDGCRVDRICRHPSYVSSKCHEALHRRPDHVTLQRHTGGSAIPRPPGQHRVLKGEGGAVETMTHAVTEGSHRPETQLQARRWRRGGACSAGVAWRDFQACEVHLTHYATTCYRTITPPGNRQHRHAASGGPTPRQAVTSSTCGSRGVTTIPLAP